MMASSTNNGMYAVMAPETERFVSPEEQANILPSSQVRCYMPVQIRKPFLITYCVLVLIAFTLLQLGAAAFSGAPYVGYLVPRSAQESCPAGATCAPAPGSWTNPNAAPSSTHPPTAPAPGSYTNPRSQSEGWSSGYYFVGGYLPTLTAILLSIWWKCVFTTLKTMEPFFQLNRRPSVPILAKNTTMLSYSSASLPKVFLSSLASCHWLTWLGSLNMALLLVCTAFASETAYITTTGTGCHVIINATTSTNDDCKMHLSMRTPLAWVLGVLLFAIASFTVILILALRRQVSGITAEASSIAGIGSLYQTLSAKGLIHSKSTASHLEPKSNAYFDTAYAPSIMVDSSSPRAETARTKNTKTHLSMHPIILVLFWVYLAAVMVMVLYYRFVTKPGTNNPFEDFMDSQSFGIKLFMTCIGLVVKLYWGVLEKHIQSIAPYAAMANPRGATADHSVLVRTASHPVAALFHSFTWRHPLLLLVTMSTILSEILVITLNTVPFSTSTAYIAFDISVYISTGIIALMLITIPAILAWQSLGARGKVGKVPECIVEVFDLLGDDMRMRFGSLAGLDEKQRDLATREWGLRYYLMPAEDHSQARNGRKQIVVGSIS